MFVFYFASLPLLEVANPSALQPPLPLNLSPFTSLDLTLSECSLGYSGCCCCCCRLLERFFYSKECCLNRTCQTLRSNLQLRDTIVFFFLPFPRLCTILIQEKGEWPQPQPVAHICCVCPFALHMFFLYNIYKITRIRDSALELILRQEMKVRDDTFLPREPKEQEGNQDTSSQNDLCKNVSTFFFNLLFFPF